MCARVFSLRLFFFVSLLNLQWLPLAVGAGAEKVFQIGSFDVSSNEFNSGSAENPVYVVGKSNPAKDWFAVQPGTANTQAGTRPHPYTIQFDLVDPPLGLYTLKVGLLVKGAGIPWLQVEMNGHRGWFYRHPKLTYDMRADEDAYVANFISRHDQLRHPHQFSQERDQQAGADGHRQARRTRRRRPAPALLQGTFSARL